MADAGIDDLPVAPRVVPDLLRAVGRFRRRVRRAGPPWLDQGLTEAQAELVRLVGRQPGTSVGEAAAELGLADNTVSTLVSRLVAKRILIRAADSGDRRVGRLRLSAAAQRRSDRAREQRHAVVVRALARLDRKTYTALVRATAALAALSDAMDREVTEQ